MKEEEELEEEEEEEEEEEAPRQAEVRGNPRGGLHCPERRWSTTRG